jgi:DNA-directed RNA polymerase sigma subunit (sigma70/sigma32)
LQSQTKVNVAFRVILHVQPHLAMPTLIPLGHEAAPKHSQGQFSERLTDKERRIISWKYRLAGEKLTNTEMAKRLDVTGQTIANIFQWAMRKLQKGFPQL